MKFPTEKQQQLLLAGPVGQLEAVTVHPEQNAKAITAIICHPHPLYAGTMNNKVVHTLAKALLQLGIKSVRFNFRGVGQSAGQYDQGIGESEDLLAVVNWAKQANSTDEIWLAGFSFGCYVVMRAAKQIQPTQLILVAPATENFNFSLTTPCPCLVLQGEADEVISARLVYEWVEQVKPAPVLIRFPAVGHFFHGQLIALRTAIVDYFHRERVNG